MLGFLKASASYSFDRAAALRYLIPSLRKSWHPGPVTIVSSLGAPTTPPNPPQLPRTVPPADLKVLAFTGQRLATLSASGQYQYSPGNYKYEFILEKVNGTWLIEQLPLSTGNRLLLLLKSDFDEVYVPQNLYFFAAQSAAAPKLVPDPVYAPLQNSNSALNTGVVEGLVKGLLVDHGSWLSGATFTVFPPGTTLAHVSFSGQTAVVDLSIPTPVSTARASGMLEQLKATLTNSIYSPPLAQSVKLLINGRQPFTSVPNELYPVLPGKLLYQSSFGTVAALGVKAPALQLGLDVTAVAAAPSLAAGPAQQVAAAVALEGGCTVYVRSGRQPHPYQLSTAGGSCTSLSWDRDGDLWAAAAHQVWILRAGSKRGFVSVKLPPDLLGIGASPAVLSVRLAPDSVRAALLIRSGRTRSVRLAAITYHGDGASFGESVPVGTTLGNPVSLSWYDPWDLVVLARSGIFEVPLIGEPGQPVGSVPDGAISITTDGSMIAVGTKGGQILTSATLGSVWSATPITGSIPDYPG